MNFCPLGRMTLKDNIESDTREIEDFIKNYEDINLTTKEPFSFALQRKFCQDLAFYIVSNRVDDGDVNYLKKVTKRNQITPLLTMLLAVSKVDNSILQRLTLNNEDLCSSVIGLCTYYYKLQIGHVHTFAIETIYWSDTLFPILFEGSDFRYYYWHYFFKYYALAMKNPLKSIQNLMKKAFWNKIVFFLGEDAVDSYRIEITAIARVAECGNDAKDALWNFTEVHFPKKLPYFDPDYP